LHGLSNTLLGFLNALMDKRASNYQKYGWH
jgi:hypothetical protein